MTEPTTFIKPEYRKTSVGHKTVDGVQFHSYNRGAMQYANISEDGQIMVFSGYHRSTYSASIIGHGLVRNKKTNKEIRFRSQDAAMRAAVAVSKGGAI